LALAGLGIIANAMANIEAVNNKQMMNLELLVIFSSKKPNYITR
jgi:hypothetical protein